jgi:catechol 2,3-dioxygenase-like lactoylglutathione lyase family enzyme
MKFKDSVPVISTADVRATVDYYARVLGFRQHFIFGEPPVYAGVERDGVLLYITHNPHMAAMLRSSDLHPDIFLWVQDVDGMFAEHCRSGAKIVEEVSDRAWDARQYVVEDPNGYRLKIAEPIDEIVTPSPL